MNELQNTPNNLIPSEDQSAWADLVICRVEVDLPNWLSQLAGGSNWQVYSESERLIYLIGFHSSQVAAIGKFTPNRNMITPLVSYCDKARRKQK